MAATQHRIAAGTPAGGQYTTTPRNEADVDLSTGLNDEPLTQPAADAAWNEYGIDPIAARKWINRGKTPDQALDWEVHGFDPSTSVAWERNGFTAERAAFWQRHQFTPSDARTWTSEGMPPPSEHDEDDKFATLYPDTAVR